jgi:DNA-binding SARP family transcriptional activator
VTAGMQFCLLGPLLVRRGDAVVPVPAAKHRVLLAALLLEAGRPVGLDELTEILWGPAPPVTARVSLQNYVMRLRRILADDGPPRIVTQPGGYLINVEPGELDITRFESALAAGRAAARAGAWEDAAAVLADGLALWRGEPLSAVPSEMLLAREVPRLAELRLQAVEARIDAELHLGRPAEVIVELRGLVAAEPLRERLHALLMTALVRDGQQAGALAAYQAARRVLVDELGAEPGPELQRLQQQVLAGPQPGPPPRRPAGPERLAGPDRLVGRSAELAALTGLLDQDAAPTVVISVIAGPAGAGKTALALHWAQQVRDRFPDGQLYLNLRGHGPGPAVAPADALAEFLAALGVPASGGLASGGLTSGGLAPGGLASAGLAPGGLASGGLGSGGAAPGVPASGGLASGGPAPGGLASGGLAPAELEERAARYRSALAERRVLVVLDDAANAEHVRPLLPGAAGCAALVTSRDPLIGLVARDGARRLDLEPLPPDVRARLGPAR